MMGKLNGRERVQLALAHREADRVPRFESFWPETVPTWYGQGLPVGTDLADLFGYDMAGAGPGVQVLFVRGGEDGNAGRSQQARDDLNEALRPCCRHDVLGTGRAVSRGSCSQQGLLVASQRKPGPGLRRDARDRIGNRIDARR